MGQTLRTAHQHIWNIIRAKRVFTLRELYMEVTILEKAPVRDYLNMLIKGAFLEKEKGASQDSPSTYRLIRDNGAFPPQIRRDGTVKKPTGRDRMWFAMKVLKRFSYLDIAFSAKTGKMDTQQYVSAIGRAGYLRVLEKSISNKPAIYLFLQSKDTGPFAPQIKKDKSVFDRNLNKIIWKKGGLS